MPSFYFESFKLKKNICIKHFSLFNHIRRPSQLSNKHDYCCFKNGIIPLWGDGINNSAGGRWLLRLPSTNISQLVDEYWKNIVRNKLFFYNFNLLKLLLIHRY